MDINANNELIVRGLANYFGMTVTEFAELINDDNYQYIDYFLNIINLSLYYFVNVVVNISRRERLYYFCKSYRFQLYIIEVYRCI